VIRRLADHTVSTRHQVGELTEAAVLGQIDDDEDAAAMPLITQDAFSPRAEAFRQLRTNLRFLPVDHRLRSLVVTGAVTAEGRTTTAANLALALAQDGEPVVLIDADLRNPAVADLFGLPTGVGLTNVLVGDIDLDDAAYHWRKDLPLMVLTSGPPPPNPSELIGSARMTELVERLIAGGATVVIDSPPLLPVTDAAVLARVADGALVVTRAGSTEAAQLTGAIDSLPSAGATLLGIVLNRVPGRSLSGSKKVARNKAASNKVAGDKVSRKTFGGGMFGGGKQAGGRSRGNRAHLDPNPRSAHAHSGRPGFGLTASGSRLKRRPPTAPAEPGLDGLAHLERARLDQVQVELTRLERAWPVPPDLALAAVEPARVTFTTTVHPAGLDHSTALTAAAGLPRFSAVPDFLTAAPELLAAAPDLLTAAPDLDGFMLWPATDPALLPAGADAATAADQPPDPAPLPYQSITNPSPPYLLPPPSGGTPHGLAPSYDGTARSYDGPARSYDGTARSVDADPRPAWGPGLPHPSVNPSPLEPEAPADQLQDGSADNRAYGHAAGWDAASWDAAAEDAVRWDAENPISDPDLELELDDRQLAVRRAVQGQY